MSNFELDADSHSLWKIHFRSWLYLICFSYTPADSSLLLIGSSVHAYFFRFLWDTTQVLKSDDSDLPCYMCVLRVVAESMAAS